MALEWSLISFEYILKIGQSMGNVWGWNYLGFLCFKVVMMGFCSEIRDWTKIEGMGDLCAFFFIESSLGIMTKMREERDWNLVDFFMIWCEGEAWGLGFMFRMFK